MNNGKAASREPNYVYEVVRVFFAFVRHCDECVE